MIYNRLVCLAFAGALPALLWIAGCHEDNEPDGHDPSTDSATVAPRDSTDSTLTATDTDRDTDTPSTVDTHTPLIPCAFRESVLPIPTGPYCVGATDFHFVDASRPEPFTPDDPSDTREVVVRVFYPAAPDTAEACGSYMGPATLEALAAELEMEDAYELAGSLTVQFRMDAPMPDGNTAFPVILFSPGLGSVFELSTALLEDLASRGYVIAAVNHPYFSAVTELPGGRIVEEDPSAEKQFPLLVGDLMLVLDEVLALNTHDPTGRFAGRFDTARIGAFGHSIGGAAAIALLEADNRVIAAIDMDGSPHRGDENNGPVLLPVLLHVAGVTQLHSRSDMAAYWRNIEGPGYAVIAADAGHLSYTDLPMLLGILDPDFNLREWDGGTADPFRVTDMVRAYNAAFFDIYLGGDDLGSFDAHRQTYPEVELLDAATDQETDTGEDPEPGLDGGDDAPDGGVPDAGTGEDGERCAEQHQKLNACGLISPGALSCYLTDDCFHACLMAADCSTLDALFCGDEIDACIEACTWFTCADGEQTYSDFECDGMPDCRDGSDEHDGCVFFTCASGDQPIPSSWECDGEPDCDDGSDEHGGCVYFHCTSDDMPIPASWECDLYPDCDDGSDEHEGCAQLLCDE